MAQSKAQATTAFPTRRPDDLAAYYFHQGTTTYAYDYLGAHYCDTKDGRYWVFRVWAPNAHKIEEASGECGDARFHICCKSARTVLV